ncbi:MAG: hypothetical protein PQJ50_04735 [Spirochaetales bacterium]|nr:hypothetical protein [Spirochaetales bacterium]
MRKIFLNGFILVMLIASVAVFSSCETESGGISISDEYKALLGDWEMDGMASMIYTFTEEALVFSGYGSSYTYTIVSDQVVTYSESEGYTVITFDVESSEGSGVSERIITIVDSSTIIMTTTKTVEGTTTTSDTQYNKASS